MQLVYEHIHVHIITDEGTIMSFKKLTSVLTSAKDTGNERIWFSKWVDGYRRFHEIDPNDPIPTSRD